MILEPFTIADMAQAIVLGLGAVGSLLLVCWQSRCLIRCRIGTPTCYCFDCERSPPPLEDEENPKDKDKDKNKKDKSKDKKNINPDIIRDPPKETETLIPQTSQPSPNPVPAPSRDPSPVSQRVVEISSP